MTWQAAVPTLLTLPSVAASGRLRGVVNLTRPDAALELTELRYDLGGEYSCRVELGNGEGKEAEAWEVLIVGEFSPTRLSTHTSSILCSYLSRANYMITVLFLLLVRL